MKIKIYWGIGVLIILLIGVSVVMLTRPTDPDPDIVYIDVEPSKETPPPAEPGYKWVWHHNHWDKVKIDEVAAEPIPSPIAVPEKTDMVPKPKPKKVYEGPLTYHAELLETNPVKALKLQAEERGHWSKDHIPPFPPSDTEAQEYAKSIYHIHYYKSIGMVDTPIFQKYGRAYISQMHAIDEYPNGARRKDLWRLTWTLTDAGKITPYGGFVPGLGRARMFASDYFPDFIDVPSDSVLDRIRILEKIQRAK